jgi:hypothetical protein
MSRRKVLHPFATTLVILVLCSTSWSQRLDGTLRGTVQDPAKAVVTGAKVTITNQDTGVTQSAITTSAGNFVFPNLIVGPYTVEVDAPGFQKYVRKRVQVLPNQIVTADAMMTVGSSSTTVEVTAGAETVQVNTSQLSNDFGGRAVSDLPNPGLGGNPSESIHPCPKHNHTRCGSAGRRWFDWWCPSSPEQLQHRRCG